VTGLAGRNVDCDCSLTNLSVCMYDSHRSRKVKFLLGGFKICWLGGGCSVSNRHIKLMINHLFYLI